MTDEANDLLMGGGIKSAQFPTLGSVVRGAILEPPKKEQMRKFDNQGKPTNELRFWPSGDPMMQVVVLVQTAERDPTDNTDDGRRRLHIGPRSFDAVRDAVKAAGAKGLEVGGTIVMRWLSGAGKEAGDPKLYDAAYARPVVEAGSLLDAGQGQAAAPLTTAPVATQAPLMATAPAGQVPAQQVATIPATSAQALALSPTLMSMSVPNLDTPVLGIDPGLWAQMPESQRAALVASATNPATTAPPF